MLEALRKREEERAKESAHSAESVADTEIRRTKWQSEADRLGKEREYEQRSSFSSLLDERSTQAIQATELFYGDEEDAGLG